MNTTPTKRKTGARAAPEAIVESASSIKEQLDNVATAAYYKAEARGFEPGQELDDWLHAEAEVNKMNVH